MLEAEAVDCSLEGAAGTMGWLTTTKRKRKPAGPAQPDQALDGGGTGAAPGAAAAPPAPARLGEAARTDAGAHEARGKAKYVELVDAVDGADADAAWAELPEGVRDLFVPVWKSNLGRLTAKIVCVPASARWRGGSRR